MSIQSSLVQSIKISLTFDNNKVKEREIGVGDLCSFEFNKNGKRKTIEGKVVKIGASENTDSKAWFIIVDGSLDFEGQLERFNPNQILDVDVIQKHGTAQYISTPNDSSRITDMRLVNGFLQVSIDGGYSWMTPKNFKEPIKPSIPSCGPGHKHPCHKPIEIEGDDSEDTIPDEEYEDGDTGIEDESY